MPFDIARGAGRQELSQTIERQVARRTWGRVHRLAVEVSDDRVLVRGWTPSYYVKQLAIQGALEALGDAGGPRLQVDIAVAAGTGRPRR
jgi:hypothetical protein